MIICPQIISMIKDLNENEEKVTEREGCGQRGAVERRKRRMDRKK